MSVFSPKSRIWLPAVCLALLAVTGCGGAAARKAKHIAKGEAYLAAANLEKARVEFRNALQIAPTDSVARYDNGLVAERLGNLREAAQFYQGAIDTNPDSVAARGRLGRLYLLSGAPEKAMETVAPGFKLHPNDAQLLTVRAAAKGQLKDKAGALQDAQRAVQLAPDDEDAVSVLAGVYKSADQVDKAQGLLQETIKRNPKTIELRLVLAQLDMSLGQDAEAESLLVDLVKLQPNEKSHRLRLAQFYARSNQDDAAERVLRDGVQALPKERDLKTALVEFLSARRGREAAEKELDILIAANPTDHDLRFVQANFYEQGKEFAKAEAIYNQVIAQSQTEEPGLAARNRLAALRVRQNDIAGAEKLIAQVLAKSPRDNDALIMRGNLALAQQDPRAAIADLRSVLRDQPNAVGVMRALARAHLENGEPALAEETMRRAVDANPNDAGARLDLAQLLAQLGKPDQAKPVIDALVKQQPNNVQALDTQFMIALTTQDLGTAKTAADGLVAAQPTSELGYYRQAQLAQADKRPDDALRLYSTALDKDPQATQPLEGITRLLVYQKRSADALKRLDDVIARFPTSPFAANLKGEVLLSIQQPADAALAFKTALERAPKWWVVYRNMALAFLGSHRNDDAISALRDGIAKTDQPERLETELAVVYERLGKPDDAIAVYSSALQREPKSDVLSNNLAMLLVTYKKDPASLERAKRLAARFASSTNPSFLDTYGWVMYKGGDPAAAVSALLSASAKSADSPISLYHLGMAEASAGQPEAARDSLTRSLQSGAKFSGMEEAKATLDQLAKDHAPITPSKS